MGIDQVGLENQSLLSEMSFKILQALQVSVLAHSFPVIKKS